VGRGGGWRDRGQSRSRAKFKVARGTHQAARKQRRYRGSLSFARHAWTLHCVRRAPCPPSIPLCRRLGCCGPCLAGSCWRRWRDGIGPRRLVAAACPKPWVDFDSLELRPGLVPALAAAGSLPALPCWRSASGGRRAEAVSTPSPGSPCRTPLLVKRRTQLHSSPGALTKLAAAGRCLAETCCLMCRRHCSPGHLAEGAAWLQRAIAALPAHIADDDTIRRARWPPIRVPSLPKRRSGFQRPFELATMAAAATW